MRVPSQPGMTVYVAVAVPAGEGKKAVVMGPQPPPPPPAAPRPNGAPQIGAPELGPPTAQTQSAASAETTPPPPARAPPPAKGAPKTGAPRGGPRRRHRHRARQAQTRPAGAARVAAAARSHESRRRDGARHDMPLVHAKAHEAAVRFAAQNMSTPNRLVTTPAQKRNYRKLRARARPPSPPAATTSPFVFRRRNVLRLSIGMPPLSGTQAPPGWRATRIAPNRYAKSLQADAPASQLSAVTTGRHRAWLAGR